MFRKTPEVKPEKIFQLSMNNYNDPYVKLLLNNQLKNCASSFKYHNGVQLTHIYANGIHEYKAPVYEAEFKHSQLEYPFKIKEITNLFFDTKTRAFNKNLKQMIYDSFCLVLSVIHAKELKSLLDQLENEYNPEKLPPIIIVQSYGCEDKLKEATQLSKLGIATIIKSRLLDGVDPLTWESNQSIDEISQTWKELTAAINIIQQEASPYVSRWMKWGR